MRPTPLEPWIARKIGNANEPHARADLERYQLEKLRETIQLARAKSPFYRKHVANAPQDLTSLDDLAQFPFTAAQDIREHPLQFLCASQDDIHRVVTLDTSGTTGDPKRIYFTRDDQELTIDFFHVGMSTFTDPGDSVLILLPCERPGSVGDLLAIALQRLGAHPIKHGIVQDISKTLAVMREEKVDGLVGIPAQVLALARYGDDLKLKSALLTTDHVPHAMVNAVERAWGCTVYNHYGMTEMGLGGGVECEARRGYHLREADLFFEVVNPHTGLPVAEGETGEVVFTTLTRRGMPLIRYRTGDLSRWLTGECPCGTLLKTLAWIKGRISGAITVGDQSQLTMADLDEALFPIASVLDFVAVISREGTQDYMRLVVKVIETANDAIADTLDVALRSIPAITLAQESSQLRVAIVVEKTHSVVARPSKRAIIDQRRVTAQPVAG